MCFDQHGFPTAGHMFRDLIPDLASRYRVIAPDPPPGFGNTKAPPTGAFDYTFIPSTFDNLAKRSAGLPRRLGCSVTPSPGRVMTLRGLDANGLLTVQPRPRSNALLFAPSCFHSADWAQVERASGGSSPRVSG